MKKTCSSYTDFVKEYYPKDADHDLAERVDVSGVAFGEGALKKIQHLILDSGVRSKT